METLSGKFYATLQFTLNAESDVDLLFRAAASEQKYASICLPYCIRFMICSRRSFHIPMNGKRKKSPYSRLHNFRCFSRVHHLLRKRSRGFLQKRSSTCKKGQIADGNFEGASEHRGDGEGEYPRRELMKQFATPVIFCRRARSIIRSCKTVSMWKRCICLWKLRSLTSSICISH